ncbi:DNA methyltransferase [Helicobacter pylori]
MSMDNKNTDEVNVIQEYKKIYDECEVADKVKILGNIQKYQIDMLKIKTMVHLQQIREQSANYVATEINDKGEVVEVTKKPRKIRGDWWGSFYKDMMNINKEANLVWKAGKKPERLIKDILEISTQENDLVLDFFAGSGTTCAVAHKMKRRYIGIEQMDYIETITKERLKKVIEGEQGGISKKCDFKGGGSFVYAELKEVNLEVKKQILNAKSANECLKIFNDLNERFLKRTDCKIDEIHSEEFQNLDLNEQKRIYCKLFDSNEDYLNLGDIDEDAWGIDESTKKYNEIFYS